jgi:hypothetical protein
LPLVASPLIANQLQIAKQMPRTLCNPTRRKKKHIQRRAATYPELKHRTGAEPAARLGSMDRETPATLAAEIMEIGGLS